MPDMPKQVQLYLDGKPYLDDMVSRTITLDQVNAGHDVMQAGERPSGPCPRHLTPAEHVMDQPTPHQPHPAPGQDVQGWPLVGLLSCIKHIEGTTFHALATQYLPSIVEAAGCLPVALPAVTDGALLSGLLDRISGLVLPGSVSNVDPERYGRPRSPQAEPQDFIRDTAVFQLIRMAIDRGVPILAICRGFQELNVACGGTLHAELHNTPGRRDHREPDVPCHDAMYAHAHDVTLTEGSRMSEAGFAARFPVCSLHRQGVDQLGPSLRAEATADDGTVEMVSMPGARGFVLGVQWHPEYLYAGDENAVRIFRLFGDAARAWSDGRQPRPLSQTFPAGRG